MYVDNIKCNSHIHEVESRYSICCFKHSATNTFPLLDQNRHQIFPFPKSMLPPLDAPAPYLVIATALLQFESSLVVSIALMSGEIWSSCCYVSGTRDRVREIHTAGLSCCSTGMSFFFFSFFSAFLSCWLQKTGQVWMRGGSAGRGVSILLTLSFSLFYMYFEVLC